MGIIDRAVYKLMCPQCEISETSSLADRGSKWGGSSWGAGASFTKFMTKWSGGGIHEPKLTLAVCNKCGGNATVESHYSP